MPKVPPPVRRPVIPSVTRISRSPGWRRRSLILEVGVAVACSERRVDGPAEFLDGAVGADHVGGVVAAVDPDAPGT
jgi:hypothetical protein